jgi:hypothetical protein
MPIYYKQLPKIGNVFFVTYNDDDNDNDNDTDTDTGNDDAMIFVEVDCK